jgi:hypothetical protein
VHPKPNLKPTDSLEVLNSRADEALRKAYEQIKRPDEQPSEPKQDPLPPPSGSSIPVDTIRPAIARVGPALRGAIGLLLAASVCFAVIASQSSFRDAAKSIIALWVPQLIPNPSRPMEKPGLPEQPSASTVPVAAPEPERPQAASPAQTPQDTTTVAAPLPPELAQLLQAIKSDLAKIEQEIEQLKTSQAQMARDSAQVTEQIKASLEQMARATAMASGHDLRPKPSTPPAHPIATTTSKPVQTLPVPRSTARPQAPSQLRAQRP